MPIKMRCFNPPALAMIAMFLLIASVAGPVYADETPPAPGEEKCGPCSQSPPPPSPPPPSPPPPSSPPPSPKKPPSTPYCPPPPSTPSTTPSTPASPSTPLIYITGPPGNLYPVDQSFNGARRSLVTGLPVLVGCGLLLLAFW
ncbi:hypothetical protein ACE6H2_003322 [Prunus campanulata]